MMIEPATAPYRCGWWSTVYTRGPLSVQRNRPAKCPALPCPALPLSISQAIPIAAREKEERPYSYSMEKE
eukprot:scaffold92974_cov14-Prasinocladus_malaysianus.AAC.1